MNKKLIYLALAGMLIGLVGNVGAAVIKWDDGEPADHLWSSPVNWDGDALPGTLDEAHFDTTPALPRAVLNGNLNPTVSKVMVGNTMNGDLLVTGGAHLTLTSNMDIGYAVGGVGVCTIDGSDTLVDIGGGIKVGRYGTGTLVMLNGTLNVAGKVEIPPTVSGFDGAKLGHLQLDGGTITAAELEMREPHSSGTRVPGVGTMDVTGGTLRVTGDQTAQIQGYIDNVWITAYNGLGALQLAWGGESNNFTTLTAIIPEPATMVLLGLGSLALYRRKKN